MTTESRQESINHQNDEISLKELILKIHDWWKYLLSKWLIIVAFGLLGAVLGLVYAILQKPVYTASTTFVLEDEKGSGGIGNLAGLASMAGIDVGGGGGGIFQGDNILSLYKSRTMLEQTLLTSVSIDGKPQLLVDRYIAFNHLRKKWEEKTALSNLKFKAYTLQTAPNRLRDSVLGEIVTY